MLAGLMMFFLFMVIVAAAVMPPVLVTGQMLVRVFTRTVPTESEKVTMSGFVTA